MIFTISIIKQVVFLHEQDFDFGMIYEVLHNYKFTSVEQLIKNYILYQDQEVRGNLLSFLGYLNFHGIK